jgi:hypothetical protein
MDLPSRSRCAEFGNTSGLLPVNMSASTVDGIKKVHDTSHRICNKISGKVCIAQKMDRRKSCYCEEYTQDARRSADLE